ncbi:hypothetical protein TO73_1361 [Thermus aquaticus Y51MC23]|uniref:Uncharacterized protein n=1 Tax=Thermus aquaticus (strain ATCC BAA-2747 / Y51MC23) TaxID=498848 RepID=A0ABM5VM07_THEA5|nr:hypothetical protein TO73_1361 [Thermus aquaticus Y51MC23]
MGKNKHLRKRLAGLEHQILRHHQKIQAELEKASPDWGLIGKWEKEIRAWEGERRRILRRLRGW